MTKTEIAEHNIQHAARVKVMRERELKLGLEEGTGFTTTKIWRIYYGKENTTQNCGTQLKQYWEGDLEH